jgi:putative ABC transport system permease protein
VFGASLKAAMSESVKERFGGDLVIQANSWSGAGISPDLARELDGQPEIDVATGIGVGAADIAGEGTEFLVVDPAPLASMLDLGVESGSLEDMSADQIAVSTAKAEDEGWSAGDPLDIRFADGSSSTVTIGAVFEGREILDDLLVPADLWAPHASQHLDDTVLVTLADGVSLDEGRAVITPIADRFGADLVQDRDEYLDSVAAEVDEALTVIYVLLAVSVLIALMGIANTLSLSIHERTRELGLLRAVGQTRRQTRRMVRYESIVIALFGTIGGIGLGLFLAWGLVQAMQTAEGLGAYSAPGQPLAIIVAVGALVGVVAAIRPARRAARTDILSAIAAD